MARFLQTFSFLTGIAVLAMGQVSAQAKARMDTPAPTSTAESRAELEAALAAWPGKGRSAVERMIARCGVPQEIRDTAVIWTVPEGQARCNPASAGIPPEDVGAYNVGEMSDTK